MKTLSKEQVLRLHNALLETFGGTAGVRDDGLLESALNAPFATFGGQYLYPSVQAKAAQLGFGLVCNHPFVDGNKRIGAHVMLVFLAINGIELDYTQEELIDIILQIASGRAKAADLLEYAIKTEQFILRQFDEFRVKELVHGRFILHIRLGADPVNERPEFFPCHSRIHQINSGVCACSNRVSASSTASV